MSVFFLGHSGFLPKSNHMLSRLIDDSKVSLGVYVRLRPCNRLETFQNVSQLHSTVAGIGSSNHMMQKEINRI